MTESPEEIQRCEHKMRILEERLRQNMSKQYDLQNEEGKIRTEMQKVENDRARIIQANDVVNP